MNSIINRLERNRSIPVMMGSLLLAILFGSIATTANLIIISLAIALLAGTFFLAKPDWIVWAVFSMGLLVVGVLPLYNEKLVKAGWAVSMLCFVLMLFAFFRAALIPHVRKNTPAFIWVILAFFVYTIVNSAIQCYSAEEFVGGFKRYFQTWGILFFLCWMPFDDNRRRRWQMFFMFVALVQLPFAIYEHIVYVPLRESMLSSFPYMIPIDVVGGTFGATLYGGGSSGEMSTFLVIVFGFLLARKMQKTLTIRQIIPLSIGVLGPLFVGETKAVFVMMPLMFLVLYRRELFIRPHYAILLLAVCTTLMMGMGYAYMTIMHMTMDSLFTDTLRYNLYEAGYGDNYLNRTTVLTFWANHQDAHDPVSFLFGNGLGSSHQETHGHVDVLFPHYGIGLTAASVLLWDTGVFGCALIVTTFVLAWQSAGRLYKDVAEPTIKADANAIQAALALFVFHIFYRLDLLETISFQIVFAAVLGYLAWLNRKYVKPLAVGQYP